MAAARGDSAVGGLGLGCLGARGVFGALPLAPPLELEPALGANITQPAGRLPAASAAAGVI